MTWEHDILSTVAGEAGKKIPALSPPMERGVVISPLPDIQIEYRGVILDKDNLVFNDFLLKDYQRTIDITWGNPNLHNGDYTGSPERHDNAIDATIKTKDDLKVGDEVILFPFAGKQQYFVACKAVRV